MKTALALTVLIVCLAAPAAVARGLPYLDTERQEGGTLVRSDEEALPPVFVPAPDPATAVWGEREPKEDAPPPERRSEPAERKAPERRGGLLGLPETATLVSGVVADAQDALAPVQALSTVPLLADPARETPPAAPEAPAQAEGTTTFYDVSEPEAVHPPVAPLMAAAVATATAAPGFALCWDRLRRVALLSVLYTRIAREKILDHESRERLLAAIQASPGVAVADVADRVGLARNTAVYHIRRLESEGLVTTQRQGRTRLCFVAGSARERTQADALATLRHETTRSMAQAIRTQPGLDQQSLCARFGVTPSLAHWHATRLVASGIVRKVREGRHVRYYPEPAFQDLVKNEPLARGA